MLYKDSLKKYLETFNYWLDILWLMCIETISSSTRWITTH